MRSRIRSPTCRAATRYRNWDSKRRLEELESDGVVAELLFPNTVPPFFPSSNLTAQPPGKDDYPLRWEGLKAHNRWMVDFCNDAPGRRAGMVQILLHDVDAAVREIEWGKEAGLFGGVLLPGIPPDSGLPTFIATEYEPVWEVCAALDMPLNHHAGNAVPNYGPYSAGMAMFIVEGGFFAHRALWMLIFAGVFERHPNLKLVLTEGGADWIPGVMDVLDFQYAKFSTPGKPEYQIGGRVLEGMPHTPREYWRRNCWVGSSFTLPHEAALRDVIGVDKIMWGQDYPHTEGTYPYTREALRHTFADVPVDEVARMVGGNAAELYGFDLELLGRVAAQVGPTVSEIQVPLDTLPTDSFSKAFEESVPRVW